MPKGTQARGARHEFLPGTGEINGVLMDGASSAEGAFQRFLHWHLHVPAEHRIHKFTQDNVSTDNILRSANRFFRPPRPLASTAHMHKISDAPVIASRFFRPGRPPIQVPAEPPCARITEDLRFIFRTMSRRAGPALGVAHLREKPFISSVPGSGQ